MVFARPVLQLRRLVRLAEQVALPTVAPERLKKVALKYAERLKTSPETKGHVKR